MVGSYPRKLYRLNPRQAPQYRSDPNLAQAAWQMQQQTADDARAMRAQRAEPSDTAAEAFGALGSAAGGVPDQPAGEEPDASDFKIPAIPSSQMAAGASIDIDKALQGMNLPTLDEIAASRPDLFREPETVFASRPLARKADMNNQTPIGGDDRSKIVPRSGEVLGQPPTDAGGGFWDRLRGFAENSLGDAVGDFGRAMIGTTNWGDAIGAGMSNMLDAMDYRDRIKQIYRTNLLGSDKAATETATASMPTTATGQQDTAANAGLQGSDPDGTTAGTGNTSLGQLNPKFGMIADPRRYLLGLAGSREGRERGLSFLDQFLPTIGRR